MYTFQSFELSFTTEMDSSLDYAQGHSTDFFLEISVPGKNSCWLANYFYVAVLLGNNRCAGVFMGKLIAN